MTVWTARTFLYSFWTPCPEVFLLPLLAAFSTTGITFPKKMEVFMQFFASAITTLQTLAVALSAGLGVWGVVNLLEGYSSDNPGSNAHVP